MADERDSNKDEGRDDSDRWDSEGGSQDAEKLPQDPDAEDEERSRSLKPKHIASQRPRPGSGS